MARMALAASMVEPPPTATTAWAPQARKASTPAATTSTGGSGTTPSNTLTWQRVRKEATRPATPSWLMKRSVTMSTLLSSTRRSLSRAPSPKYTLVLKLNSCIP